MAARKMMVAPAIKIWTAPRGLTGFVVVDAGVLGMNVVRSSGTIEN